MLWQCDMGLGTDAHDMGLATGCGCCGLGRLGSVVCVWPR